MFEFYGMDGVGRCCIFIINFLDEYIIVVDVRVGGWIDVIRLYIN